MNPKHVTVGARLTLAPVFLSLFCLLSTTAFAADPTNKLTVVTERPGALYSAGDTVKFQVHLSRGNQPVTDAEISYTLDKDGMPPVTQGKLKLGSNGGAIEGTLAEPGFLRCRVTYTDTNKTSVSALAGAGFDPLQIKPSLPVPQDFDAFWIRQKARLREVPMQANLTPVKSPAEGIECFDIQISCLPPRPVSGYFAKPIGAKAKSLAAILYVHGAGVRSSSLSGPARSASQYQVLAMDINAHGITNGQPEAFYKALADGELKDYRSAGREDRETCYFLGMFLRLVRALDFLTSQPEWDGRTLIVSGSSQGGGQSIAAGGLDPRVTLICTGVPAICDHSGKVVGRINGWPKLVPDVEGKPDPKVLEVARYFDGMNFATRVKAEALFSVGLIDSTCPPSSVYAAYNNLPGKKRIVIEPLMGHAVFPSFTKAIDQAIRQHLAARK